MILSSASGSAMVLRAWESSSASKLLMPSAPAGVDQRLGAFPSGAWSLKNAQLFREGGDLSLLFLAVGTPSSSEPSSPSSTPFGPMDRQEGRTSPGAHSIRARQVGDETTVATGAPVGPRTARSTPAFGSLSLKFGCAMGRGSICISDLSRDERKIGRSPHHGTAVEPLEIQIYDLLTLAQWAIPQFKTALKKRDNLITGARERSATAALMAEVNSARWVGSWVRRSSAGPIGQVE